MHRWRCLQLSLPPRPLLPVPAATTRVARAAVRRGTPSLLLHDELGPLFTDRAVVSLYGTAGHPATSPALLALVTATPSREDLTDEQAADAVRSRVEGSRGGVPGGCGL